MWFLSRRRFFEVCRRQRRARARPGLLPSAWGQTQAHAWVRQVGACHIAYAGVNGGRARPGPCHRFGAWARVPAPKNMRQV